MQIHSDYDIIKTIFSLRSDTLRKIPINLILYTAMFLIAGLLVISASHQSHQAVMSIPMPVHFTGEYSQSGGEWQMLDAKTDLSSYNGAVTLRGRFDTELLEGAEIRFYLNHIGWIYTGTGKSCMNQSMKSSRICAAARGYRGCFRQHRWRTYLK